MGDVMTPEDVLRMLGVTFDFCGGRVTAVQVTKNENEPMRILYKRVNADGFPVSGSLHYIPGRYEAKEGDKVEW